MSNGDWFLHCPRCGVRLSGPSANPFRCGDCGFRLYFNPAVSVGAFVFREDGRMLWLRRSKEPARGRLGLPGGFIDFDETAEAALAREIREEVGLAVKAWRFLCSRPNEYRFGEVTYRVLDLFFVAEAVDPASAEALEEVESLVWLTPEETRSEDVAFPSVRDALTALLSERAARR
ncbi:MAG: NUDIX hydrolase [Limisphaerales bacterium]